MDDQLLLDMVVDSKKRKRSSTKKTKKKKKKKKKQKPVDTCEDIVGGTSDWHQVLFAILQHAKDNKLRRHGDHVMKPHPTIENVYVRSIDAKEFINSVCRDLPSFQSASVTMNKLVM